MREAFFSSRRRRALALHAGTALLSLLVLAPVLQLWRMDIRIPLAYEWKSLAHKDGTPDPRGSDDALIFYALFKGERENGWYLENPNLGFPEHLDMRDYPMADGLNFLLVKVIGWFTPDYAVAVNLFFLFGFPLTALTALCALRYLRVHDAISVAASLLYAFLPYHFLRGQQHLFLASYWMVPLLVLVILWIVNDERLFVFKDSESWFPSAITRKGWAAMAICVLAACSGLYYAMFAIFFLFVGVLLFQRRWTSIFCSLLCAALIMVTLAANILPSIPLVLREGWNSKATEHLASDGERYGLKMMQMFVPAPGHRLPSFSEFAARYLEEAPLINENASASLGAIGSIGFVILVLWQLGVRWDAFGTNYLDQLAAFTLSGFLLATIGGASSWLCFSVSSLIRCYNRVSIFIALFSLMAIALVFQRIFFDPGIRRGPILGIGVATLLALIGLLDQTTPFFIPAYDQSAAAFLSDRKLVREIEDEVPPGSVIFQLPNVFFPVSISGGTSLLRPYLHSTSLRWTYGTLPGRVKDKWRWEVDFRNKGIEKTIETLRAHGLRGVLVDRNLLPNYRDAEDQLRHWADASPIVSANKRHAFFRLEPLRH